MLSSSYQQTNQPERKIGQPRTVYEHVQAAHRRSRDRGVENEQLNEDHVEQQWEIQGGLCSDCQLPMEPVEIERNSTSKIVKITEVDNSEEVKTKPRSNPKVMSINRTDSTCKSNAYSTGDDPSQWNFDLQHWGCNRKSAGQEIEPWLHALVSEWSADLRLLRGGSFSAYRCNLFLNRWEQQRLEVIGTQYAQMLDSIEPLLITFIRACKYNRFS